MQNENWGGKWKCMINIQSWEKNIKIDAHPVDHHLADDFPAPS